MKKFIKKYKKLFGMLLLLLAIAFFIFWEFIGRSELLNEKIVVLNKDILKGTIITADMLIETKIDVNNYIESAIKNGNSIIGLEAKQYIPAKAQLVNEYFNVPELVLGEDEKIMKLPNEWIHSYPETLRRKDHVFIYAVKSKSDSTDDTSININIKNDKKEKQYIFSTTVAYVKDNANREVESLDTDRLIGSSSVSVIEIVITDEEFKVLENYAKEGYTFTIMYQ